MLATQTSVGLSQTSFKPYSTGRRCARCERIIPEARLKLKPTALLCARCQEQEGDVQIHCDSGLHRTSYGAQSFALLNRSADSADEQFAPRDKTVGTVSWSEFNENTESTGNATNTGLHVISEEGKAAWRENGKKKHTKE